MALESVRKNAPQRAPTKSLCDGAVGSRTTVCQPNDPPYRINNAGSGAPLNTLTVDADATHGEFSECICSRRCCAMCCGP